METYGLVSTAFHRFPDLMLQVGGSLGSNIYFFGQVSDGNPSFLRDPNALAGDNGTTPPPNPVRELGSGFPIFYHAEVEDLQIDDEFEYGGGAGLRWLSEDEEFGVDLLGFYYQATIPDETHLTGTFYQGDLELLRGERLPARSARGERAHRVRREPGRPARSLRPFRPVRQGGIGQPPADGVRGRGQLSSRDG